MPEEENNIGKLRSLRFSSDVHAKVVKAAKMVNVSQSVFMRLAIADGADRVLAGGVLIVKRGDVT
jgi:predicted transcriptional regulator